MAVPVTNVGMDSIQTEFGGTNPISMNEYYAGGTYVRAGTQSPIDPNPVPSSGTITIGEFRGTTKVPPPNTFVANLTNVSSFPINLLAGLTFYTYGATVGNHASGATDWFTPNTTGIGSSFWIKMTVDDPTFAVVSPTTWTQLSSDTLASISNSAPSTHAMGNYVVSFATDSAGINVTGTVSGTFSVGYAP